jgi:hypothetical protein
MAQTLYFAYANWILLRIHVLIVGTRWHIFVDFQRWSNLTLHRIDGAPFLKATFGYCLCRRLGTNVGAHSLHDH